MNAKTAKAGWDLFPELAVYPCPCRSPLCCCKALSNTTTASLVLSCAVCRLPPDPATGQVLLQLSLQVFLELCAEE